MEGDASLFAREDGVLEAWRIVDAVLPATGPVHVYEPGTWGPDEADRVVRADRWHEPQIDGAACD
jgi:glucose-6-phosphate 1-dehydrogenase